ncbi:MAG: hypothetical protein HY301_06730 [Verrucomicrobia bacterium]|nr:hypothetical protein [Verrucomicrobiota bacterium]
MLALSLAFTSNLPSRAASFVGTNAPGAGSNFTFTLNAAATNLSLIVTNNSGGAWSHLLLKLGGTASDTNYDFIAQLDGAPSVTNAINLQLPELTAGTHGLLVRTPAGSATHAFGVSFATNIAGMRSNTLPVNKPQASTTTGALADTQFHYFRIEIPSNSPGWRLVLNSTGPGTGDLYVRKGSVPDTNSFDKRFIGTTNATVTYTDTEATPGAYFVGVRATGGTNSYTLYSEVGYLTTLTWDPGTTATGTQVFTNSDPSGGFFYFKIQTQNAGVGAWRTALKVLGGEADVFLKYGSLPATNDFGFSSTRVGSDGMVLHSSQFTAGQDWFLLVRATPGATWTLLSGEVFAYDLGPLAADASSGTNINILPEGMAFFKTTAPADTLAWRLGLNGATNTLYVKKSFVPHPISYEQTQDRAMLLVEPYLGIGTFNGTYFVCVPGNPGVALNLDSRKQPVTDIPFGTNFNATVSTTNFPYLTYRVQVPVQQIAWQLNLMPTAGDGNLAVRRDLVPNEYRNDAFSDVAGAIGDSVTLVPPTLANGTFYVTVYGGGGFTNAFTNGNPIITDVNYLFSITNDAPNRAGWRFYRVPNIAQQLGTLGWELLLANQPTNTEIALRQNAVPGRWNFRNTDGSYGYTTLGYVDLSNTNGFLQQPGHQADIWYIGVYSPTNALTNFILTGSEMTGQLITFDSGAGTSVSVTNQPAGKWKYFRVDVPTNTLGWDLRLVNVTAGNPGMVVRRDQLPAALSTSFSPGGSTNWPTGASWAAGADWTGYANTPAGAAGHVQTLAMGMNQPLEAGTYYVGVYDGSGASSFTLQSRGIGPGFAIPIRDLDFSGAGGTTNLTGLVAREAAYFRVVIASNTPSWKVKLTATAGDSLLQVAKDFLPNVINGGSVGAGGNGGKRMQKPGNEHFALLPYDTYSNIAAGTYYLAVVSEGVGPDSSLGRIGTGSSDYTLASLGAVPVTDLGTLTNLDLLRTNSLEAGELAAYRFTVATNTQAMEVRLDNRTGNPRFALRQIDRIVGPVLASFCDISTFEGGHTYTYVNDHLVTLANPVADTYSMTVFASVDDSCNPTNASHVVRIHPVTAGAVAFDGGVLSVTNQEATSWRYFQMTVPTNALGWDVRLVNVSNTPAQMYVCRDVLPPGTYNMGLNQTNWPSTYQVGAGPDWTGYNFEADGSAAHVNMMAMGMGNPLEPGTYFIGVYAPGAASWTLKSRGIGTNLTIPVFDLNFSGAGGSTNGTNLATREAAYYRVTVPSNTPSWKVRLTNSVGDALLLVQRGALPSTAAQLGGYGNTQNFSGGRKQQKIGDEQFVQLAPDGATNIAAGTYYLAVVGEGIGPIPNGSQIGSNSVNYTLSSLGSLPVLDLGTVSAVDLLHTNALPGGSLAAYQFTVPSNTLSVELSLENITGAPDMSERMIDRIVGPFWGYSASEYVGSEGGQGATIRNGSLITLASPSNGLYSVTVSAWDNGGFNPAPNAGFTFRIHAVTATELTFDGGTAAITNQNAGSWRYFHVTVPAGPLGWELRMVNANTYTPVMVVQRDTLPDTASGNTFGRNNDTNWPSGARWTVDGDWSQYTSGPDGANTHIATLSAGMGNPLEPGSYYIGVYDGTGGTSYSVQSRGIGTNQSILVRDLSFSGAGGTTNIVALPVRDATYFRVVVPSNTPSWRVRLAPTNGEAMLLVNREFIPNVVSGGAISGNPNGGHRNKQPGNEHYAVLPPVGATNITPGTYFIGVVSEGVNPSIGLSRYGSNSTGFSIASLGTLPVTNLGTAGVADLVRTNFLEAGDLASHLFTLPSNAVALEVRLENVTGIPAFTMGQTNQTVAAAWAVIFACDYAGSEGGQNYGYSSAGLVTVPNPVGGSYSVTVNAQGVAGACAGGPDATATLRVRQLFAPDLNFSSELNTNGNTNVATGVLADTQRAYYRVVVPTNLGPAAVLGWRLDLTSTSGTPSVRARKNLPPEDGAGDQTSYITGSGLIVPPFLTNGVWYLEVKGGGNTTFTLTSRGFTTNSLQRVPFVMPTVAQTNVAPGLALPEIGDTGTDTNGVALPGDRGVDLADNTFHYYAVIVPSNNAGLLRTELDAISGNPNLYLRQTNAPTLTHNASGTGGSIFDRSLTGTTTEYGNWIPLNGRYESGLPPGTWVIAVHASGGSNCRYRLRLACGNPVTNALVQNLALDGGLATNQSVAGGDWRYYRIAVPSNAPANLAVNFSRSLGGARVFVRDSVPPGDQSSPLDYDNPFNLNGAATWNTDLKNQGPYSRFDSPGTLNLTTPPLRPGANYFLGVWSLNDTTFSLSTSTNGGALNVTNVIPFYGGFLTNTLPANGTLLARVDVPGDAARWKSTSVHPSGMTVILEQGTVPILASQHYTSGGGANSTINQYLLNPNNWPWIPSQAYYLLFTNTTASPVPFSFTMNGRSVVTDDEDADGLPDAWEILHFGNTTSQNGAGDPDGDGLTNLQEYLLGTDPLVPNPPPSLLPASLVSNLFVLKLGGEIGLTYRVQRTTNFNGWFDWSNVLMTTTPMNVTDSVSGVTNRNYRAILAP